MIFEPRKVKRILMVGVLDVPSSTNVFMAKGFEKLGYFVEAYNYRTRAMELGSIFAMWKDFEKFLIGRDYKLIVFCKANQMHPELLTKAREVAPTWYWFMDPLATGEAINVLEYAKYATFASATSIQVVEKFREVNQNSYHIVEGFDPDIYFYEKMEREYDICFIGNATPKRVQDLSPFMEKFDIKLFGHNWPPQFGADGPKYNEDERRIYNSAKIVLNLVQDRFIFSDRVIKALACGATVISQGCDGLDKMFIAMRNGITTSLVPRYDDIETFSFLHKVYTKEDVPELARQNIAKFMRKYYSWKATCIKIMDKVGKNY
jgi:hypothetical protein